MYYYSILSFSRRRNLVLSIIGLMILFIKKFELYYTMCEETFWCIREFSFSRKTCCCIVSISAWFLSTMPSRIHVLWARFIHHIRRFPNLSNFIVHYGLEKEGYFRFFWIMIKLFLFMGSPALYVEILVLQHITQYDKNEKIVQWKAWKKGQIYVII